MKKRNLARVGATAIAIMLAMQSMSAPITAFAEDEPVMARSDSNTQMSSELEKVYINKYGSTSERSQNFDDNWKFYLGDASGAENPTFDDSQWRQLSLPHDYSIEQEYTKSGEAESGYLLGGIGWYRKNFTIGEEMKDKRVRIDFDGVYMNSTVYINGKQVGTHPYGYTPFSFDITDHINFGKENTIAVKVDHQTPSSRWYSGSGIYRSVHLTTTDKVHVDLNGVKVESPKLADKSQDTKISTAVRNESDQEQVVIVKHTMFEKGKDTSVGTVTTESKAVPAGESVDVDATMKVQGAKLWSPKTPNLYTVRTEVTVGEDVVDTYETDYGFRHFAFDTNKGFSLNGEKVKLKGVCMHHDQGALGAVANRRAIERQVEILKEMGCNSIRVTHNPAASELIDVCNEKGMIVIDEFFDGWMYHKNGNSNDYAKWFNQKIGGDNHILGAKADMTWAEFDLKATVKRGQNAPSIIMWSLGNEIQEGAGGSGYHQKAAELIKWAKEVDHTRVLTIGSNAVKNAVGHANNEHIQIANQLTAVGGASGTNYSKGGSYDSLHHAYPEWNLYGSETASATNSRGVYTTKRSNTLDSDKQLTSYDKSAVGWGDVASAAWYDVITRDFVAGEYVWTGFDYIGEPTPANGTDAGPKTAWPSPKNSYFGIVDTAGLPKDSYYFYQSQWNDDVHTLHVLPTWNEDSLMKDSNGNVEVVVYSDAAKVELKLNGRVIETKEFEKNKTTEGYTYQTVKGNKSHTGMYMTFDVPYEEGTLEAVAYDEEGNVMKKTKGRSVVKTAGEAKKLKATADRKEVVADGKDLIYVTVDVTDDQGTIVPKANHNVKFEVKGGTLVGVDNGKQSDHQSYKDDNRNAYNGSLIAIVQATDKAGDITVTATSKNLVSDSVTVPAKASGEESAKKQIESVEYSRVYYVKTGTMPKIPTKIKAHYLDGTSSDIPVTWDTIKEEQISKNGSFIVEGKAEQCNVSVVINMIDDVAALLNYSTTTQQGTKPQLPKARPAVLPDGTVLSASFPVTWTEKDADAYNTPGDIVTVDGTTNVFGKNLKVSASVRVAEEKIEIGDSVSAAAELSQDIPKDKQSDTLDAIKNGSTRIGDNSDGGPNEDCWSNWANSTQHGDKDAELTFKYDTQQRIGRIVIHYARDNGAMQFPNEGTTEIFVSETGKNDSWKKVNANETIGKEKERVKAYTYEISPITATFVKFKVVSPADQKCVGITEIELKKATGSFSVNATAKLAEVKIAGKAIPSAALSLSSYTTPETDANKIEAKAADNAALTVLPVKDKVIRMIMESEDHHTRNKFEVRLDEEESVLPGDDSKDYPVDKIEATAASEYKPGNANEGPVEYVLDGNPNTHWHTNWSVNEATKEEKRAVTLEMKPAEGEKYPTLDALRYLRRQGNSKNGAVTEYKVECSMDQVAWETVSTGTWDKDNGDWQIALFQKPVQARYVRLTGVHTYADGGNDAHMSVAELRVRTTEEQAAAPDTTEVYDPSKTTATAGSTQAGFGPEKALDHNMETWWHSSWNPEGGTLAEDLRWFQLELDEEQTIAKLMYTPRNGNSEANGEKNGAVTKYRVECSLDGQTWKSVSEGEWPVEDGAKEAVFTTPTKAKYVRLVGVETFGVGNQNNKYMSAAEVRIEVKTGEEPEPTPKEFTVTFHIDGTNQAVTVEEGNAIGNQLPADPAKEGCTFLGWNTKADGTGERVDASTVVNEDMTVYAMFEEDEKPDPEVEEVAEVTVTFDVDGTTTAVAVEKGNAIGDQLLADPTKEGYIFKGWNTKADGTGTTVTKDTVAEEDMTVYAIFEKQTTPSTPSTPEEKPTPTPDQKPSQTGGVKTGDQISVATVVGILVVAAAAIVTIIVILNKKRKH